MGAPLAPCCMDESICAEGVVQVFCNFDANDDGKISIEELGTVLRELDAEKWTDPNIKLLFRAMDTDSDGCIQYTDFLTWVFGGEANQRMSSELLATPGCGPKLTVVNPVVLSTEEPFVSHGTVAKSNKKFGSILIFIDVDGVLNTKDEISSSSSSSSSPSESESDTPFTKAMRKAAAEEKQNEMARRLARAKDCISDPKGRWGLRLNRGCLRRLRELLMSFDEGWDSKSQRNRACLVLTSTQRLSEEQTEFIKWALRESRIGAKMYLGASASISGASRNEEIMHFLAHQAELGREVSAWVAIDDDPANIEALGESHRIETSIIKGLDAEAMAQARRKLARQDLAWHAGRHCSPAPYCEGYDPSSTIVTGRHVPRRKRHRKRNNHDNTNAGSETETNKKSRSRSPKSRSRSPK